MRSFRLLLKFPSIWRERGVFLENGDATNYQRACSNGVYNVTLDAMDEKVCFIIDHQLIGFNDRMRFS